MHARRLVKVSAGALWLALAGAAAVFLRRQGLPPARWPEALRVWIAARGVWGPALYILIFVVRPLVFLPPTVLTAASGLVWGPLGGTFVTLVGENVSAAVAFWGARVVGGGWAARVEHPLLARLRRRLCGDAFRAVLVLRLLFAPFDLVNFACGLTTMSYRAFAAATFLGILPGVTCIVLLGSSWRDPRLLAVSAAALALGLGGARALKPAAL